MSLDPFTPGYLNLYPITDEVLTAVFDELVQVMPGTSTSDGIVAGVVLRHTYNTFIKRGLLTEQGLALVREELKRIEDMDADHKH